MHAVCSTVAAFKYIYRYIEQLTEQTAQLL